MESTNFQSLQKRWPQLYEHANFAEQYVYTDAHTAIVKLRCFAEQLVGILYRELNLPCERNDGFFEKLKSNIFIEARYTLGLTDIFQDNNSTTFSNGGGTTFSNLEGKNAVIQLGVGYRL